MLKRCPAPLNLFVNAKTTQRRSMTAFFLLQDATSPMKNDPSPILAALPPADTTTIEPERALKYSSDELLKGHREVWIEHGECWYRLRLTSAGKLYLTK